jgi:hypothetical protein
MWREVWLARKLVAPLSRMAKKPRLKHLYCVPKHRLRQMALHQPLNEALDAKSRALIGKAFFQSEYSKSVDLSNFAPFFRYYDKEIKWLRATPMHDQILGTVIKTHDDIATIVDILRLGQSQTRPNIRLSLRQQFGAGDDEGLNRSIDIAARLWSMINIRESFFQNAGMRRPAYQWNDNNTLEDFLASLFPPSKTLLGLRES